jgi:hypothetical protein
VIEDFNGQFEIVRWTELEPARRERDLAAVALQRAT